jgi:hypothetical protein
MVPIAQGSSLAFTLQPTHYMRLVSNVSSVCTVTITDPNAATKTFQLNGPFVRIFEPRSEGAAVTVSCAFGSVSIDTDAPQQAIVNPAGTALLALRGNLDTVTRVQNAVRNAPIALPGGVPVMANPPGITVLASNATPADLASLQYNINGGSPALASYQYHLFPGSTSLASGATDCLTVTNCYNSANWTNAFVIGINDGTQVQCQYPDNNYVTNTMASGAQAAGTVCAFITDAPIFAFFVRQTSTNVWINGQLATPCGGVGANASWVLVNNVSRQTRQVVLTCSIKTQFGGVAIGPNDTIAPFDITKNSFNFSLMGDSYFQQQPSGPYSMGMEQNIATLIGTFASMNNDIGGTGYDVYNGSSGNIVTLPAFNNPYRIASATGNNPDLIFVAGGINDSWPTGNVGVGTNLAIQQTMQKLRVAAPSAIQWYMGPWCPVQTAYTIGSKYQLINAAILANLQAGYAGTPWIFTDNNNGAWSNSSGASGVDGGGPWQTGTGFNGSGTGNGKWYLQADDVHPTVTNVAWVSAAQTINQVGAAVTVASTTNPGTWPATGSFNVTVAGVTWTVSYTSTTQTTFAGCTVPSGTLSLPSNIAVVQAGASNGCDYYARRIAKAGREAILAL